MNILFICKHNRFRSKLAEGIFKKLNKNPRIKVKSAGVIKSLPVAKNVIDVAENKGVRIGGILNVAEKNKIKIGIYSRGLSEEILHWADVYVIVADDVPVGIFSRFEKKGKKIIVWKIKDVRQDDVGGIERTFDLIYERVEKFVDGLNRKL